MSFDENNIIFKQYFIPDKYDKSLIFSKTLQDYIAGIKGLKGSADRGRISENFFSKLADFWYSGVFGQEKSAQVSSSKKIF